MQHLSFGKFRYQDLHLLLGVDDGDLDTFTDEILNVVMLTQLTIAQLKHDTVISGQAHHTVYLAPNPNAFMMAPYGGIPGIVQPTFIADPNGSGLMIPNPAAGTYQPILVPQPLHPSITKALDYLKRILDSKSPYWSNLKDILDEIEKFFSKDFLDYEQLLMKILDQMFEVREFEDKVLKIDIGKDKDILPTYSYIYKNLEVKVDPSSKEGYSSAGKALYEKLKQNREYIKYNKATLDINPENILYDLTDDLFMKILTGPPAPAFTTSFFNTGKGIKYKEYLKTREGAEALFKALSGHTTFGQGFNKAKIAHVLMLALTTYTSDPDVYNIYKTEAEQSIAKNQPKKPGKKDDKKKDPNKKSGTNPSGGGGGGAAAATTGGT
jgi:tetratricopeptide (TPR) repeat protein